MMIMVTVISLLVILGLAAFGAGCSWIFWWLTIRPIEEAGAAYRRALAEDYVITSEARRRES